MSTHTQTSIGPYTVTTTSLYGVYTIEATRGLVRIERAQTRCPAAAIHTHEYLAGICRAQRDAAEAVQHFIGNGSNAVEVEKCV